MEKVVGLGLARVTLGTEIIITKAGQILLNHVHGAYSQTAGCSKTLFAFRNSAQV